PWSSEHWLKKRFFDTKSNSIFSRTTNYQCNEWLDDADIDIFNDMQKNFPRRYEVEGLGNWGIAEGLIYENWRKREFDYTKFLKERPDMKALFGMDFGYTNDPTAFIALLQDENTKELYIFDEHYEKGMLNDDIAKMITKKGFAKERIIADSAEPKSIAELKKLGILRVRSAKKGPDSVRNGIDRVNSYRIYVHP
ncbi:MAG: terminase large subunit, partial [Clostridiales bacterium]